MSVLLTACRNSRQRAIERALKKKEEKKKEKKQAKLAELVDQLGVPEDTPQVKIWTFLLNGKPNSIVYHLDSLDVTHNGEEITTKNEFTEGGSRVNFWVDEHTAQIVTESGGSRRNGLVHTLLIDGNIVPE
ncbi:fas apoptotic inhibitory molecule 1-like [Babylonia areolata]|uniref:fas apoptotic inhibitory molecule 1-like n=1 Tax=Babylonia areolata TaxID=304850 RepID=UPI003FCF7141